MAAQWHDLIFGGSTPQSQHSQFGVVNENSSIQTAACCPTSMVQDGCKMATNMAKIRESRSQIAKIAKRSYLKICVSY